MIDTLASISDFFLFSFQKYFSYLKAPFIEVPLYLLTENLYIPERPTNNLIQKIIATCLSSKQESSINMCCYTSYSALCKVIILLRQFYLSSMLAVIF